MTSTATTSTNDGTTSEGEELFVLVPCIPSLDGENDGAACDAFTSEDPDVIACGHCARCVASREAFDDGRDEAFALVGLPANDVRPTCSDCHARPAVDASGYCEACGNELAPNPAALHRCPAGCSAGYVTDPHGPSRHNPLGLAPCPVCG